MHYFILLMAFFTGTASAADYVQQVGSSLGFTASYQGEEFTGTFSKFNSNIRFDPAKLAESKFDVRIVLSSASTQNAERDETLMTSDFFNAKAQPEARYVANKFRALGLNRFVAEGVLTLRGVSKPVPLTFSWKPGAKPQLIGSAQLRRLDFKVGIGDWNDVDLIPNTVTVNTKLILAPAPVAAVKAAPVKTKP
jgi:polyisoprenoid-binding protein YceI